MNPQLESITAFMEEFTKQTKGKSDLTVYFMPSVEDELCIYNVQGIIRVMIAVDPDGDLYYCFYHGRPGKYHSSTLFYKDKIDFQSIVLDFINLREPPEKKV